MQSIDKFKILRTGFLFWNSVVSFGPNATESGPLIWWKKENHTHTHTVTHTNLLSPYDWSPPITTAAGILLERWWWWLSQPNDFCLVHPNILCLPPCRFEDPRIAPIYHQSICLFGTLFLPTCNTCRASSWNNDRKISTFLAKSTFSDYTSLAQEQTVAHLAAWNNVAGWHGIFAGK